MICEWLEDMNPFLIKAEVPISKRVWLAACCFVQDGIIEIQGDSTEDFITKPWFRTIYQEVHAWYFAQYGEAILQDPEVPLTGVCIYQGDVFELHIPKTLKKIVEEGQSSWVTYPADLQETEKPLLWVQKFLLPEKTPLEIKSSLEKEIVQTANDLRQIHVDILTTPGVDEIADHQIASILPHIERAASDLCKRQISSACWEGNQSAENALKALCRQRYNKHLYTHDLQSLYHATHLPHQLLEDSFFSSIPNGREITNIRAGEGRIPDMTTAYTLYRKYLRLSAIAVDAMERSLSIRNASFHLQKPPFID
jgi:hypothetical protein